MIRKSLPRAGRTLALSASVLAFGATFALAQASFDQPAPFAGQVMFSGPEGQPIHAGHPVAVRGQGFAPGQTIQLLRGAQDIAGSPLQADQEGKFSLSFDLPADAVVGLHPVVVLTDKPDSAEVKELKVSPNVPFAGAENFEIVSEPVTRGLYQVAYSPKSDKLFVASAVGRPPVKESALSRVDADTLKVEAQVSPSAAPAGPDGSDGGVLAVYGIAVDDANGTVWVTNTRQNTVAVYRQDDLSLVKQFPVGAVSHPRDVVVDADHGRAFVSAARTGGIEVFDTKTLEQLEGYTIQSKVRGGEFMTMSLAYDKAGGKLYTVSMDTPEVARIDVASGEVEIVPVPGAVRGSGIAVDPATGRIFVASQGSDDLIIVDGKSGEVLHDVAVGAGSLNVAFDAQSGLAFVANRASGSITAVDADGRIVANLDAGSYPNHLIAVDGHIYAVNKARGENDAEGDRVWRIVPKS